MFNGQPRATGAVRPPGGAGQEGMRQPPPQNPRAPFTLSWRGRAVAFTTRDAVVATAPELGSIPVDDPRWARFLDDADAELNASVWGGLAERGARYLVAHWFTISRYQSTGRGMVQSETVGGVSRTYASTGQAMGAYETTSYGMEYRRLQRMVGGGPH